MYGRGPLGARRFCKECTERSNRPISYENALLSFGPREKASVHWGNQEKNHSQNLFFLGGGGGGGGGGSWNVLGGTFLPPTG